MNGMTVVSVAGGGVGEFHGAAEFVALSAGRNVEADPGFEDFGDLLLELADFGNDLVFLRHSDVGLKSKRKHVDEHDLGLLAMEMTVVIFEDDKRFVNRDSTNPILRKQSRSPCPVIRHDFLAHDFARALDRKRYQHIFAGCTRLGEGWVTFHRKRSRAGGVLEGGFG
jgi:hypothetical protein